MIEGGVVGYADALAAGLRARSDGEHKKRWGQYFTCPAIARFMAGLVEVPRSSVVRVLDPGAGTGVLGLALARRLLAAGVERVELTSVEREEGAYAELKRSLGAARRELGEGLRATAKRADVLELGGGGYDLVIGNPPYFKMSPSEQRGGDAPNVYARFMTVAARLLRAGGQLCFIVPRSYASGYYFRRFRRGFHEGMQLERVHVFESRARAFARDAVLQETIVVVYRKGGVELGGEVRISSCGGVDDLEEARSFGCARGRIVSLAGDGILSLPTSEEDLELMARVRRWPNRLETLGLEVSTGPVVPFRCRDALVRRKGRGTVPLLWLQHVHSDGVRWPLGAGFRKPEHMRDSIGSKLLVPRANYVVVRRVSSKEDRRRLTAAALLRDDFNCERIGLENHLNFIHRPGAELEMREARGLAALLNSPMLDRYFRIIGGNTQVSATELRGVPLPEAGVIEGLAVKTDDAAETRLG